MTKWWEFESVIAKLWHAFNALPEGRGLLSLCNWVLRGRPATVYLHCNKALLEAITDVHFLLHQSTEKPTCCQNLVAQWSDFVGIVDALSHGKGGVIIGEGAACLPMVFRLWWLEDVTAQAVLFENPTKSLTNLDLEMAGLLLLCLCVEGVCGPSTNKHVVMFSDNLPAVSWVERMATCQSQISVQLVRALAFSAKYCIGVPSHAGTNPGRGKQNGRYSITLVWQHCQVALSNRSPPSHLVQYAFPTPITGPLDHLPNELKSHYESDFRTADDAYLAGRVAATAKN